MKQLGPIVLLLLAAATGCRTPDILFGLFGDAYSGGGETRAERQAHYDQQVDRWSDRQLSHDREITADRY